MRFWIITNLMSGPNTIFFYLFIIQSATCSDQYGHHQAVYKNEKKNTKGCHGLRILNRNNLGNKICRHRHHVHEGLGVFPIPWSPRWSWSLHLFLGRPIFIRLFGLYCSACFSILFVSILYTCCSHFFWYHFISCTMFCAPVFWNL